MPAGTTLKAWTWGWRASQATGLPTRVVNGVTYKVISGYLFDSGTSGQYLYIDEPNVIFENSRFVTSGQVSNTSAMLQQAANSTNLIVQNCDFDGGTYHQRGIQANFGITVLGSRFTRFGNAAIEMDNSTGTASMRVENSYFYEPKGWIVQDHTDGIQLGGGKDVTIRNNTILITAYGGVDGDLSYVSNSALGFWSELGQVSGSVVVDHNLLAGGGKIIYIADDRPVRTFQGSVAITNNVFDRRFAARGGIWGVLYPTNVPPQLSWASNTWEDGTAVSLAQAMTSY